MLRFCRHLRLRRNAFFRTFSFMLAGFLLLASPALAESLSVDYFGLEPEQLLHAEVTSVSKKPEKLSEAAAAVYIITSEDIMRSGVTTIPDALRMAPGVQVAQSDSNSWAISIRGFNNTLANKLLVMIDGRTVYNPLFAGTYWELQDLVLEDVDRIEVIRGPGGALWGANAVNGVINIITKSPKDTQGNLVKALYGTEEKGTLTAGHSGLFGQERYYRVYGKGFSRDSSHKPNGDDGDDEWESYRGGFRMDWADDFILQGDIYRTDTDQLNSTPILIAPYGDIEKETMTSEGGNIMARLKRDLDNGGIIHVQSYIDYTSRDQILLQDQRTIVDLEAQYNLPSSAIHEIAVGGSYRYVADDLGNAPSVTFAPASRQDNILGAFIQDKITLAPEEWYLTLGSKFEHNDYTGFELQPNARLEWLLNEQQTLWSSISRAVRTPSRLEHDLDQTISVFPPGVFSVDPTQVVSVANRDFDSEKLTAYEIGYRNQITPTVSADIATFYNYYDDLSTVGFLPTSTVNNGIDPQYFLFPINAVNNMKGKTYGVEVSTEWAVNNNLKFMASYSHLKMMLDAADEQGFDLETAEKQSPRHQANVRSYWNINDKWSLDSALYYVDKLEASDVDNYVRLDLNLGWKIDDNVRLNLIGQNLLDNAHREFGSESGLNAAEIQRSVFGKLTWQF